MSTATSYPPKLGRSHLINDRSHGGRGRPYRPLRFRLANHRSTEEKLFLFPSYVRHEVRPNFGERDRISIAMDVFVKRQDALIYFGPPRWYVPWLKTDQVSTLKQLNLKHNRGKVC